MEAKWIVFYNKCFEDYWDEKYAEFPYENINGVLNFLGKIDDNREYRGITLGLFIPSQEFNNDVNQLLRDEKRCRDGTNLYELFQKYFSNDF